jgi:glycosyltransferase involved in cell wall biosynthesis
VRLGFISGRLAARDAGIRTDAGVGRLIEALGQRADAINVALSVGAPMALFDHHLAIESSRFFDLPSMPSFRAGVFRHREASDVVRGVEACSDVVVVQLPFPVPSALILARKPRVYHVCADVLSLIRGTGHYRGWAREAAIGTALGLEHLYRLLIRVQKARIVANGDALLEKFSVLKGDGASVVSSTLFDREIGSAIRARPPSDRRFRIAFVGYLRPEKGISVLVAAFERVLETIPDAELVLIGPAMLHQQYVEAELKQRLSRLVDRGSAKLLGPKSFGPELFQSFADADVLALPSLSEGTPRVLVEARAFGCPVVASNVGGIPTSVEHEVDGLLVPPRDPARLAEALVRIATDADLREKLVARGFERARRSTVDVFADEIVRQARAACANSAF